jgi:hypothetical protein
MEDSCKHTGASSGPSVVTEGKDLTVADAEHFPSQPPSPPPSSHKPAAFTSGSSQPEFHLPSTPIPYVDQDHPDFWSFSSAPFMTPGAGLPTSSHWASTSYNATIQPPQMLTHAASFSVSQDEINDGSSDNFGTQASDCHHAAAECSCLDGQPIQILPMPFIGSDAFCQQSPSNLDAHITQNNLHIRNNVGEGSETARRTVSDNSGAYEMDLSVYTIVPEGQIPEAQPDMYVNRCVRSHFTDRGMLKPIHSTLTFNPRCIRQYIQLLPTQTPF